MNGQFARAYLGIGEVLAELRGEFPDISVSKIRFLESEGLISPARSPSGYRRFGSADVDQLRFILTAQRDQYLPLRVIKERLRHRESAARPERSEMISRRDLLDSAGIDAQQLAELEEHGLVCRVGRLYSQDALDIAAAVAALAAHGVQARHLRTVRTAADKEVSLIEQVVAPTLRQRSPQARKAAERTAGEIAGLLMRLHAVLIDAALAEAGLAGPPGGMLVATESGALPDRASDGGRARPGVTDATA
jgi:DNA-binding transcriptional MerR regulator